jgi:hypothetical protein
MWIETTTSLETKEFCGATVAFKGAEKKRKESLAPPDCPLKFSSFQLDGSRNRNRYLRMASTGRTRDHFLQAGTNPAKNGDYFRIADQTPTGLWTEV